VASEDPAPGAEDPIRIGVSSCLLGEKVRFDGQHKRDRFLTDTFGDYVDWVPVCPEVEMGLGIPREPIRLVRHGEDVALVTVRTGLDHTMGMRRYSRKRTRELASEGLSGYIVKKDSPSCGMERVKIYPSEGGPASRNGRGLFTEALMERFPRLPVEEEGRLCDPRLRENFVERVFAYHRLRRLFQGRWTVGRLVAFHTAHKLQLLAHSPAHYRELGPLVAAAKKTPRDEVRSRYETGFMEGLAKLATVRRNVNVLQHMLGYFKKELDSESRHELLGLIDDYRSGLVPLVVPITLFRHYVRRFDTEYLRGQTYLEPHPKELMLRNHV
jgi:uncharacterized protein YbgA (DUF1722 family)/uncharacterized protein YbbK (DUF523 family)